MHTVNHFALLNLGQPTAGLGECSSNPELNSADPCDSFSHWLFLTLTGLWRVQSMLGRNKVLVVDLSFFSKLKLNHSE